MANIGKHVRRDPWYVRLPLTALVVLFLGGMVVLPLANVFARAFDQGGAAVVTTLTHPNTLAAVRLSLAVAALSVTLNVLFGLAAAWAVARCRFRGKALLTTLIDLPFSVSPVVAGLLFVLLFGADGWFGPAARALHFPILFAVPGIVLTTTFVTLPFVARELVPVLEAVGTDEEQAARTLGARGWQTFWHVTLPNVKWGLLYGVVLCGARALGEFGAVSVVSGKKEGQTDTLPILVEKLYQGLSPAEEAGAFAVAALLAGLALATLAAKALLERKAHEQAPPLQRGGLERRGTS